LRTELDYSRYSMMESRAHILLQETQETLPNPTALPPMAVCREARKSRDPRFDGRFFVGVLTTGVYCRPICPARMPAEDNVRYYSSAAAAQDAGYRPCRRCRPEASLNLPEWTLASETVMRGLRLIEAGYLNDHSTGELGQSLEVGERQLTRLFNQELGTSPASLARIVRAKLARGLLAGSSMPAAQVAYHAGYGSVSRFNHEVRKIFQCTPSELRGKPGNLDKSVVRITLPVRPPYNFDWVFGYLQKRALDGVEEVTGGPGEWGYRRLVDAGAAAECVEVKLQDGELHAYLPLVDEPLHSLIHRVRRVFDLNADGETLHDFLASDERLGEWVLRAPGLRVPGAWDGFETAVRAVLGQQVSVARGTDLANHMIARYGAGHFPTPAQLLNRDVAELGMPGRRGRAVTKLAQATVAGELTVDDGQDFDRLQAQLENLEGIGPWTANYIRMRALKDPDAFPDNDWVVLKELNCSPAQARRHAEPWRPWRAYALMYLWYAAGCKRAAKG
jgi:AraC family transcriptional regulator of adaptative response / DNA-3-methyladenine glycosylase II